MSTIRGDLRVRLCANCRRAHPPEAEEKPARTVVCHMKVVNDEDAVTWIKQTKRLDDSCGEWKPIKK